MKEDTERHSAEAIGETLVAASEPATPPSAGAPLAEPLRGETVGRFTVQNGFMNVNALKVPWNASGENLRTQFGIAHQDENHAEELRIAEIIIRDFPNTQMAKELRDRLGELRRRATEPATAQA